MTRKKRVAGNARRNTFYLTPAEELALDTIEKRRRARKEDGDSPSEVIADAIWDLLKKEGLTQEQIEALLPVPPPRDQQETNVKQFPDKKH